MASSTLKTILGFLGSVLERRTPFKKAGTSIDDIYNYVNVDGLYPTSGQPNEQQFRLIRDAGYDTVINLAPSSVLENSLTDERALLEDLGMTYIHIPVDFKNPTDHDFEEFVRNLEQQEDQKVWVHCAANMRVSAFTYRYRRSVLGQDEAAALADLQRVWEPFGVWKSFISR